VKRRDIGTFKMLDIFIRFRPANLQAKSPIDSTSRSRPDGLASFPPATCTRKRVASFIVHFAEAKCNGQMRQMRVRIRPSILSLYYQTMQLPIGSAGSEFSRRARRPFARARAPRVDVSFFPSFFLFFFRNVDLV